MNKSRILDYVFHTLGNTNPSVLNQQLIQYADTIKTTKIEKISDYFYKTTFTTWDYMSAYDHFKKIKYLPYGCSSISLNGFYGRNYDWKYDERVSFFVKCEGDKPHKSIGMSAGLEELLKNNIEITNWSDLYELIPFMMLDGINDAGVFCNINVAPTGDYGHTIGTNPNYPDISAIMLVRYILDYANSANHALSLLQKRNIICPPHQEVHFMIGDINNTYVVEFINNSIEIIDSNILTNFYLYNFNGTKDSLTDFGSGFERYNILQSATNIEDIEDMQDLLASVFFTNAYKITTSPIWYTDFVGEWSDRIITNHSTTEEIMPIIERARQIYEDRTRNGILWQTVHSSVYDITNKTLTVRVQEDTSESYNFNLTT